ncbi:aKG-HExxH-type peptide beta-hydroxylase [Streptomyces sp. NBC_00272]|uniref:aKG-HExxH-type peptide beta-hydroxylase n=1 Tax=Streptomyces sp. NBC_00272 TaxID=2975698 RepID=UPI002E2DC0AA|nr:HEXXH motif-containing putative peptide modification protein [Streptomyces sp. NBC_00272]
MDALLVADGRFGDSGAIGERNVARFVLGLRLMAQKETRHQEVLRRLSLLSPEELLPLLGDPVLRNAFEDDMVKLENGRSDALGLADLAARLPLDQDGLGPCERMATPHVRPWPEHGPAWLWTEMSPADGVPGELSARLRRLYDGSIEGGPAADPVIPTPEMCRRLSRGADLLTRLLPQVGPSVLRHVSVVGFTRGESVDGPLQSLSGGDPLPSAILMAPERLTNPWTAAETLLHEGVHLKLFDALRSGALLRNADPHVADLSVPIPWRQTPWRLVRVLVALHFYVHMLVFQEAARHADDTLRAEFGDPPAGEVVDEVSPGTEAARNGTYGTSWERARYLSGYVLALPEDRLTADGRRFLHWLLDALHLVHEDSGITPPAGVAGVVPVRPPAVTGKAVVRRTARAMARPLPERGELLVVNTDTAAMHWLNARSWLIYSLCDGRDAAAVAVEYGRRSGSGGEAAHDHVAACISELTAAGLLE